MESVSLGCLDERERVSSHSFLDARHPFFAGNSEVEIAIPRVLWSTICEATDAIREPSPLLNSLPVERGGRIEDESPEKGQNRSCKLCQIMVQFAQFQF